MEMDPMSGSGAMSMPMDMMPMYFRFTNDIPHLLFKTWRVNTDAELFGAMVFSFALAVLYEGLKTVKDTLAKKTQKKMKLWLLRVVLSGLRTVEIGMAYLLMLLAMTYNVWIFLSVSFGAGTGFLLFLSFRPTTGGSSDDHCG